MAKVARRWIIVYLHAYSKGESTEDLKVVKVVKVSTMVEVGSTNSGRTSEKSKTVRRLGQAVVAGVEGSTMESSVVHRIRSSYGQHDQLTLSNLHRRWPRPLLWPLSQWTPAVPRPKRLYKGVLSLTGLSVTSELLLCPNGYRPPGCAELRTWTVMNLLVIAHMEKWLLAIVTYLSSHEMLHYSTCWWLFPNINFMGNENTATEKWNLTWRVGADMTCARCRGNMLPSATLTFEKHLRLVSRAAYQRLCISRKSWRVFVPS